MLSILSLGAGVQSSTLALMAARGEVMPMPIAAIFADTKAESQTVYKWLDWLEVRLPFPVYRVRQGEGLKANIVRPLKQGRFTALPAFTESPAGCGQLKRQCTSEFKVKPIMRQMRRLVGIYHRRTPQEPIIALWLGISRDESYRMRDNREPYIKNRWPLVELGMRRSDCLAWMEAHGYPKPPRSSCVFCPYHSDEEWRHLRDSDPEGWLAAVAADELVRGGVRGTRERLYLHRSLHPLAAVDLRTEQEHGQLELWDNECEGVCGL
jgi:hypothetical protein